MRFNAAIAVLAGSAIAAPAANAPAGSNAVARSLPAEVSNHNVRSADAADIDLAALVRRLETSSLADLTSEAGISLPDNVVDQANDLSGNIPDIAGVVVGLIINIRNSIPLLKNTPLQGVVNLALPIIEGVLSALNTKNIGARDLHIVEERSLDLVTNLLSSILGIVTGLLGGVTGAAGGDLLGGLTGGAGGLVSGLTGGLTGGSGAGGLLGGLTGASSSIDPSNLLSGLTNGVTDPSSLTNTVTNAVKGGELTNPDATVNPAVVSNVTDVITAGSALKAATLLSGLPGVGSLGDIGDLGGITDVLGGLTNAINGTGVSTDALGQVANVLDFALTGLSTIALVPASLLPDPLDAPFRALSGELEALKPIVDALKDILNGGLDVANANDLTKLYDVLDQLYDGLKKLSDEIIPKVLQPTANYGLAGLLSVIKTVLTVASGYIATASQEVKNLGGNSDGLTSATGLINGN